MRRAPGGADAVPAQSFARWSVTPPGPAARPADCAPVPHLEPRARSPHRIQRSYPSRPIVCDALLIPSIAKVLHPEPPLYGDARGISTAIDSSCSMAAVDFCEHYAGATVFLLRASGPTRCHRVPGGEYHPSGHLIVRQSDAHAWVEAWLDGYWTRIDPTAAVAPDRVERGLQEALPETERLLVSASSWLSFTGFNVLWKRPISPYTKWVIGFDRDRQRELLKDLGLGLNEPLHCARLDAACHHGERRADGRCLVVLAGATGTSARPVVARMAPVAPSGSLLQGYRLKIDTR